MSHTENNDNFLCARIEALKLTAVQDSIEQAITGFVIVGQLDIAQLKLHAHLLRKRLQAEGTTLKTTHAQELVACKHGFRNWQTAIVGLKS
ncbi:hypothetical protein IS386_002989 [Salmonella enterica]|nr:hypothetical protein [Salmonella enterica]EIV4410701.1 hypothetical protein [Salmonella enterica]